MNPQIRAMTAADLDAVGDTTQAGGFGDRREFFRTALALGDGHAWAACPLRTSPGAGS